MKCKHLKLIMELIFIFILPLLFILPCIKIKDNYVYDNEGNYQVSEKVIDFQNPLNYEYYTYDNIISCDMKWTLYTDGRDIGQVDIYNFSKDYIYYIPNSSGLAFIEFLSNDDSGISFSVVIDKNNNYAYSEFVNERCYISYSTNVLFQDDIYIIYFNEYSSCWINNASQYGFVDLEKSLTNYSNPSLNLNSNYKYFDIDLNTFGKISALFLNVFNLNNNVLIDIVIVYTFLWLIMFFLWHFIYCVFDFIVHIVDKQRRRE